MLAPAALDRLAHLLATTAFPASTLKASLSAALADKPDPDQLQVVRDAGHAFLSERPLELERARRELVELCPWGTGALDLKAAHRFFTAFGHGLGWAAPGGALLQAQLDGLAHRLRTLEGQPDLPKLARLAHAFIELGEMEALEALRPHLAAARAKAGQLMSWLGAGPHATTSEAVRRALELAAAPCTPEEGVAIAVHASQVRRDLAHLGGALAWMRSQCGTLVAPRVPLREGTPEDGLAMHLLAYVRKFCPTQVGEAITHLAWLNPDDTFSALETLRLPEEAEALSRPGSPTWRIARVAATVWCYDGSGLRQGMQVLEPGTPAKARAAFARELAAQRQRWKLGSPKKTKPATRAKAKAGSVVKVVKFKKPAKKPAKAKKAPAKKAAAPAKRRASR